MIELVGLMKDNETLKAFGNRIRQLRKNKRWAQKELAAKIWVRFPQLNKYECGLHAPPFDKLVQMAEALTTTVDYLLTGHQSETAPLQNRRLVERLQALERFENDDQEMVIKLIDAMIVKNRVQGLLTLPQ